MSKLNLSQEEIAFENIEKAFDDGIVDSELYTKALFKIKDFRDSIEKASKQEYSDFIVMNERGDKILLLLRGNTNKKEPNKFCLPGGHIDEGENVEAAAYRELKEETGIEATPMNSHYMTSFKNGDGSTSHYFCTYCSEDKMLMLETSEHFNYEWVRFDKIKDFDLMFDLGERISNMVLPKPEIKKSNPFIQFVNSIADNVAKVFSKPEKKDEEFFEVLEDQSYKFDEGEISTKDYFELLSKESEGLKKSFEVIQKAFDNDLIDSSTYFKYKASFEKAVYKDNAENRKLKRVGQEYGSGNKADAKGQPKGKEEEDEVVGKHSPEELQQKAKGTPDYYLEQAAKNAKDPLMKEAAKKELAKRKGGGEAKGDSSKESNLEKKPPSSKEETKKKPKSKSEESIKKKIDELRSEEIDYSDSKAIEENQKKLQEAFQELKDFKEQELNKDDENILGEEKKALKSYTSSDYREINRYIRKGRRPPNEELENYIKSVSSGINKLDKHEGTVYRAESPIKELSEYLNDFQKGNEIQFASFTSTTKEKSVIDNFGSGDLVYQIKSKNGREIEEYSDVKQEKEVLFDTETNFKVSKVKQKKLKNGMLIGLEIFLEEI